MLCAGNTPYVMTATGGCGHALITTGGCGHVYILHVLVTSACLLRTKTAKIMPLQVNVIRLFVTI